MQQILPTFPSRPDRTREHEADLAAPGMRWGGGGHPVLDHLQLDARATIRDALAALERGGQAIVFVHGDDQRVIGTITDGDLRRALLRGEPLDAPRLTEVMHREFTAVGVETGRAEALDLMSARGIGQLPVLDDAGRLVGLHTVGHLLSPERRENPVVILAGGRGTRLYPITRSIPKPMVTVAGRPILERIVLHLMSCGFRNIYLSVNHLAHVIEQHFGDGERFGCTIRYLHEREPLGTGGPMSLLEPAPELPVIVLNGDLVTQCDLGGMLDFHERGGYVATIGLKTYTVEVPFGVAEVEGHMLRRLEEKPAEQRLINAGMYVLSPGAVRMIPGDTEFPITDLFGRCLDEGRPVGAYVVDDEWIDIGRRDELRRARGEE